MGKNMKKENCANVKKEAEGIRKGGKLSGKLGGGESRV